MAVFTQNAQAQRALWLGVKQFLMDYFDVSAREVERWRAFVAGLPSQARNPAKRFKELPAELRIDMTCDFIPMGDDAYKKKDYNIWAEIEDVEGFIRATMQDPSEGYQVIFDANSYPDSRVENVHDLLIG